MKFENTEVWGFKHALRGMRNPLESWHKADSFNGIISDYDDRDYDIAYVWTGRDDECFDGEDFDTFREWLIDNSTLQYDYHSDLRNVAYIGPADMKCARGLIKGGPEHRKFLRQIFVSVDITAPLYWWKEFDTYKIGTTANSTSTMHKIHSKPITLDCFEMGDWDKSIVSKDYLENILIPFLEGLRLVYLDHIKNAKALEEKGEKEKAERLRIIAKANWKELIRWLPESWLQTRTVTMSYENLFTMFHQRKHHKLIEWSVDFIKWVKSLPYAASFITMEEDMCAIIDENIDNSKKI